jgi:hypothetical protein
MKLVLVNIHNESAVAMPHKSFGFDKDFGCIYYRVSDFEALLYDFETLQIAGWTTD